MQVLRGEFDILRFNDILFYGLVIGRDAYERLDENFELK